jgi:hypothetical protein
MGEQTFKFLFKGEFMGMPVVMSMVMGMGMIVRMSVIVSMVMGVSMSMLMVVGMSVVVVVCHKSTPFKYFFMVMGSGVY